MQKITPYLWFDKEAREAANLYTSIFENSKVVSTNSLDNTPSGTVDLVSIQLCGQDFGMMSAGPYYKINPSISFLVACDTPDKVERLWHDFSNGGSALMELGIYPFSEKYGWIQDRFGVSWQLMLMGDRKFSQIITPTLMFVGDVCGKTEEAVNFYTDVFNNSKLGPIMRYAKGEEPDVEGTIKHMSFTLEKQEFAAMDSARLHEFVFNEAISFIINCEDQKEIDYYWDKLSAVPESEQCGWLKDKYGVSWQVVPIGMNGLLINNNKEKNAKIIEEFLKMKKIDIAQLKTLSENAKLKHEIVTY